MNLFTYNKIHCILLIVALLILALGEAILQTAKSITNESCSIEHDLSVYVTHSDTHGRSEKTIDDNLKSYWEPSGNSSSFVIDVGKVERICFLDILWHNNHSEVKFQVSSSTSSNNHFKEVYTGNVDTSTSRMHRYDFADVSSRYLNFTFFDVGKSLPGVTELDIYAYKHGSRGSRLPELPILAGYDDFDNKTTTQSKWTVEYTGHGFSGRIAEKGGNGIYRMFPMTSTSTDETHASLVTTVGDYSNFRLAVDSRTDDQLRKNSSPKKWEVGWTFFRYTDTFHYYWFSLKPNGFELGKKDCSSCTDPVDGQIILLTGPLPTLKINAWSQWIIEMKENKIKIFVDGNKIIDFVDPSMSEQLGSGKVAMYTEDAKVSFDNFYLSPANMESVSHN
jgi:hypothetical protein